MCVVPEDKDMILEVLGRDEWKDLEDGLQMQCAKEAGVDYAVTQNLKDFQKSKIEAVSEGHFCKILKEWGFVRQIDYRVIKCQGEDENASPF